MDFNWSDVEDVEEVIAVMRMLTGRKQKSFKGRIDPFSEYNEREFRAKYRFSKDGVRFLEQLIGNSISVDKRGGGLSSSLQILTALRYWGRNQIQDDTADIHGVSQQSITNVCNRVARAILEKRADYIKMPSFNEQLKIMQDFESIAGFEKVIGAIDCTHVRITKVPGPTGQLYINRKGYSSLNVQVVADSTLKIRDLVARWRGSTHDARIFNESILKQRFEDGEFCGVLLGDSGYPCTNYLFTPLLNPITQQEERYNNSHTRTRNIVERCFGVWKNRFRCLLTGFRTSLENTKMYIVALAVLHNIAVERNEEPFIDDEDIQYPPQPISAPVTEQVRLRGAAARSLFIQDNF